MNHIRTADEAMNVLKGDVRNFQTFLRKIHPMRAVEEGTIILFDHFPTVLLGIGIVLGSVAVAWIVYRLFLWFGLPLKSQPHFRIAKGRDGSRKVEHHDPQTGRVTWRDRDIESGLIGKEMDSPDVRPIFYSNRASIVHFLALLLKIVIIVLGFYTGFWVAGFSFFNMAISLGVVGIVVTYAFSTPIFNIMGAFIIYGSGHWVEGMSIAFNRDNWRGTILQQGTFFTVVKIRNPEGKLVLRTVPNKFFIEDFVDRYVEDEEGMEDFNTEDIDRRLNKAIGSGYDPTFIGHLRRRTVLVK